MWMRWNETTHIFERSTNDGASWSILPLDASVINEGAINIARLPANVARKDIDNLFTAAQTLPPITTISGGSIQFLLRDTSAPVDARVWRFVSYSDGILRLEALNDAVSVLQAGALSVLRTGEIQTGNLLRVAGDIYEKARGNPIGGWINQAFNAAHYSVTGGGTWTIGAPAVIQNRYCLVGKVLHWNVYISWFSGSNICSGTITGVRIQLPGGFTEFGSTMCPIAYVIDAGGPFLCHGSPSGGGMVITKNDGSNFNAGPAGSTIGVVTTMTIEIA